jgi:phosphoenolpyruvate carboxylase
MDVVLAKSSLAIASRYARLVEDVSLRDKIFARISREWRDSVDALNANVNGISAGLRNRG